MKYSFLLIILSFAFITSCGSDVDCDVNAFNNDIQSEFSKLESAANVYAQDPTDDNCKKFKDAAEDYLDAIESYGDCTEFDQVQYQEALQQARDNLNQVVCN